MYVVVGKALSVNDVSALITLGNTERNAVKEAGDPLLPESRNVKECGEAYPARPQREIFSFTSTSTASIQ